MITDYQHDWPQLVKISEILFGHTDYQVLTRGGLSILINRTLRNIRKSVFGEKKLRRRAIGGNFFMGYNRSRWSAGREIRPPSPPCQSQKSHTDFRKSL